MSSPVSARWPGFGGIWSARRIAAGGESRGYQTAGPLSSLSAPSTPILFGQSTGLHSGEAIPLQLQSLLERQLAAGETHEYLLTLTAGQYVRVAIDQRSI